MWLRVALLVLVTCVARPVCGQLIRTNQGKIQEGEAFFDVEFVRNNRIKSIKGDVSFKREMQPIRTYGLMRLFEFNPQGRLSRYTSTFRKRGGRIDTTSITYQYDDILQLVAMNTAGTQGFNTYRYNYDADGRIKEQSYSRGPNLSGQDYVLERGREILINREQYTYEANGEYQVRKTFLNNDGQPYKYANIAYDSLGNVTSEAYRFVVTDRRTTLTYTYDDHSRLIQLKEYSNLMGSSETIHNYSYDQFGNISVEKVVANGEPLIQREFLYHEETMLLKAMLIKDEATNDIDIIQYHYEFYE